jgi:hypothetical protein
MGLTGLIAILLLITGMAVGAAALWLAMKGRVASAEAGQLAESRSSSGALQREHAVQATRIVELASETRLMSQAAGAGKSGQSEEDDDFDETKDWAV